MHPPQSIHGVWSSRWIFILAATGSAVGLGNIWKFPYIVGDNGGGAFVLVYLACILLVGMPILMSEVMLGRRARQSPSHSVGAIARESGVSQRWALVGLAGAIAGFLIFTFYSVVSGWVLAYVHYALDGRFVGAGSMQLQSMFDTLLSQPSTLLFWHTLFVSSVMLVVARGVRFGLEKAIRILMPTLLLLLLMLVGYGAVSGGLLQSLKFLFWPDFSALTVRSVLVAMGHAFFTLSLGMGAMMVYGAYLPRSASISHTVLIVLVLDTLIAVLAGLATFPLVFANQLDPATGPGLMFVTLPLAFGNLPGGQVFAVLFFLMVAMAAWTSAISLLEPAVTWLMEHFDIARIWAGAGWLLGVGGVIQCGQGVC